MSQFDCQETKRHVHEYLHNELTEIEITEITAHLAGCDSCEGDYDVENALNGAITRSCGEVPPQELAERILAQIRELQKEIKH